MEESINWKVENEFDPIPNWHAKSFIEMCQKHSVIKECEYSWEFELQTSPQISQEISGENGQNDFVIEPLGPEYANFIDENWKFKNDTSLEFITR